MMNAGQEQDFISRPAENQVEGVEDVTAQEVVIHRTYASEGKKLDLDLHNTAVRAGQFQGRINQHDGIETAHAENGQIRGGRCGRPQFGQEETR